MMRFSKELVKRLPQFRPVFAERDQLRVESAQLRQEQEQLKQQREQVLADLQRLQSERDRLRGERDLTLSQRYELFLEGNRLRHERDQALAQKDVYLKDQWVIPGHYYSPIPDMAELKSREKKIWGPYQKTLPAIDMNDNEQLGLFNVFKNYYREMPDFPAKAQAPLRYFYDNDYYPYGDAIPLHCMIRYLRPRRIIEVGSGYSSCVTLDTNERDFNNSITCTFIEPYPDRLRSLLRPGDKIDLIEKGLQDVDLSLFRELGARDILFIDSTHVVKCGSDVNYIFFEILPALARGVSIHIHDIFYPFEYPQGWVYGGKAWTEDYLLRAFLQYNQAFKVQYFNSYLVAFYREMFEADMPLCLRYPGGSIWMRKV